MFPVRTLCWLSGLCRLSGPARFLLPHGGQSDSQNIGNFTWNNPLNIPTNYRSSSEMDRETDICSGPLWVDWWPHITRLSSDNPITRGRQMSASWEPSLSLSLSLSLCVMVTLKKFASKNLQSMWCVLPPPALPPHSLCNMWPKVGGGSWWAL